MSLCGYLPPLIFQVPVKGVHALASPLKSAVSAPPAAFAAFATFAAVLAAAPVVADAEPAGDPVGVPLVSPTQASQKPIQGAVCRPPRPVRPPTRTAEGSRFLEGSG
jgi:hypothetical protein